MTPDEACNALTSIGADVSRRTLLNYEKANLIPIPERGGGRKGRYTNYPNGTIEEAFAAWSLLHGRCKGALAPLSPAIIKILRDNFYANKRTPAKVTKSATNPYFLHAVANADIIVGYTLLWEAERLRAKNLLNIDESGV